MLQETAAAAAPAAAGGNNAAALQQMGFDHLIQNFDVVGWAVFGYLPEGPLWLGVAMILAASSWLLWSERSAAAKPLAA